MRLDLEWARIRWALTHGNAGSLSEAQIDQLVTLIDDAAPRPSHGDRAAESRKRQSAIALTVHIDEQRQLIKMGQVQWESAVAEAVRVHGVSRATVCRAVAAERKRRQSNSPSAPVFGFSTSVEEYVLEKSVANLPRPNKCKS